MIGSEKGFHFYQTAPNTVTTEATVTIKTVTAIIAKILSVKPLDDEYRALQLVARIDQLMKAQGGVAEYLWHDGEQVRLYVTIPTDVHARALLQGLERQPC